MALKPRSLNELDIPSNPKKIISRINIRPKLDYYRNSIYEYDINAAGYSILKHAGALTEKEVKFLDKETKKNRNVYIGNLMEKDSSLIAVVETGLLTALNQFLTINSISNIDILTVKRDSVFVLKKVNCLQVKGDITFKLANKYSGFFGFDNYIEMYYSFDLSGHIDKLIVKGLSNNKINSHDCGILNLVKYLLEEMQSKGSTTSLISVFDIIKKSYLNLSYPIEYYRELNRKSYFRLKDMMLEKSFLIKDLSEDNKDKLDITYNYKHVLLPIMSSILS